MGVMANKILGIVGDAAKNAGGAVKNGFMKKGILGLKNDLATAGHITKAGKDASAFGELGKQAKLAANVMKDIDKSAAEHVASGASKTMEEARSALGMASDYETASKTYQEHVEKRVDAAMGVAKESAGAAYRYFIPKEKNLPSLARAGVRYGTAAIGLRYLSGGDLTHNAKGEKDIAGLPW